jgi:hypothetical protein
VGQRRAALGGAGSKENPDLNVKRKNENDGKFMIL